MRTVAFRLRPDPMARIRAGVKRVEGRLVSGRTRVEPGDHIEFRLEGSDAPDLVVEVEAVRYYPNFAAMVRAEGVEAIGFPAKTEDEVIALYRRIYWYPDAEKNGVRAIEIRPVAR